jgi:hypothetical protein
VIGRSSVDLELLIGYCCGIRSERRLCEEVHLNLAYRWFCGLGLDGAVPDHSTFSKNRHGRFRDSDLLRRLFEATVRRCMAEGIVGGQGFVVDASMIRADANRQKGVASREELDPEDASRAVDRGRSDHGPEDGRDFVHAERIGFRSNPPTRHSVRLLVEDGPSVLWSMAVTNPAAAVRRNPGGRYGVRRLSR